MKLVNALEYMDLQLHKEYHTKEKPLNESSASRFAKSYKEKIQKHERTVVMLDGHDKSLSTLP